MTKQILKQIIASEYAVHDGDKKIPRLAAQFVFQENDLLIRVPLFECDDPECPSLGLIFRVIKLAQPQNPLTVDSLKQTLAGIRRGEKVPETAGLAVTGIALGIVPVLTEIQIRVRLMASHGYVGGFDAGAEEIDSLPSRLAFREV